MRSSKSRSRGNKNRSRPSGNIVNRVFDSNGPDGKVRGTPQQIIDKYNQLHRDAQLAGDRVDAENFAQHAEHYLRMLAEAQKEQDAKREEQERQNRERQAERDRERNERLKAQEEASGGGGDAPKGGDQQQGQTGDVIDTDSPEDAQDSGLVETPESKPKRSRSRKPKPKPKSEGSDGQSDGGGQSDAPPEAAE